MKPKTTEDIFELLDAAVMSAALGAAMEHNLFWILAEGPKKAVEISEELVITVSRCQNWLELMCSLGLLNRTVDGYQISELGKTAILDAYSPDTWAFLAREARKRYPVLVDLALNIKEPVSIWETQGLTPPDYFEMMRHEPEYARGFTRMLYEIHRPLANEVATMTAMSGATNILDLGGGSGVMSLAFLDRCPTLRAIVVDIDSVCAVGQDIARERGLSDRITYQTLDYIRDTLPKGFDRVLYCDAGPYTVDMFKKIREALVPNGRLIMVDQFSPAPGIAPAPLMTWAFLGSLQNPASTGFSTAASVISRLEKAGFREISVFDVPHKRNVRWEAGWQIIEASA
ncbi:methyltransferase [bacterium]|nr:methyltransferase [candidate division CSSED10-310 bacterium]